MSYSERAIMFRILKSIIANIDGSTNTTWKVGKNLDLAKVHDCCAKSGCRSCIEDMEEAESGEIAIIDPCPLSILVQLLLATFPPVLRVRREHHRLASENGVSGHVRNRHTFIPPLCKEKGVKRADMTVLRNVNGCQGLFSTRTFLYEVNIPASPLTNEHVNMEDAQAQRLLGAFTALRPSLTIPWTGSSATTAEIICMSDIPTQSYKENTF
jgi:hypothetical protein